MALCYFICAPCFKVNASGKVFARSASDTKPDGLVWYVTNDGRRNVLSGPGGAVLTDKRTAQAVAELHNARAA